MLSFWVYAVISGVVGWRATRRVWWRGVPILVLIAMAFVAGWTEWTDPVSGPDIAHREGRSYPYHLVASTGLAYVATVVGMVRSRRAAQRAADDGGQR